MRQGPILAKLPLVKISVILACGALLLTAATPASGQLLAQDDPGLFSVPDEPALIINDQPSAPTGLSHPRIRLDLGFGYSSLLEDPDVSEGYGGGIYLGLELYRRLGAELSLFAARNNYTEELGEIGRFFLAGNITLGPTVRLTPPRSRLGVTLDFALGTYLIVPVLQGMIWTLGISGGATLSLRVTSWFGISIKPRYHLFNLANFSGPDLRDIKAFMKVGVIDRLEIPVCLSFFY
jgi:hypothetical protein